MAVKITAFEAENVKRVKAVQLEPTENGLTVIGGRNNQGKTSVLDAIAWALGGDRNRPAHAKRDGSVQDPRLRVELSNGIVVERSGKNSSLRVIDPAGNKGGQKLLDSFIDQLALNLPKFMDQTDREKADTLLRIIGVGNELAILDEELQKLENQRLEVGRIARQKRGAAEELPFYADQPAEEISASDLIKRQQGILAVNAENKAKRDRADKLADKEESLRRAVAELDERIEELKRAKGQKTAELDEVSLDCKIAAADADGLEDLPTDQIEEDIRKIDETNERIRANARRRIAIEDAEQFEGEYDSLDNAVKEKREQRRMLLEGANMPLDGLSVDNGMLTYKGQPWDGMSGSDRLKVATAIVRELKPECGFVLVDKLEQMDPETLEEFGAWAKEDGLQVIGTRVATDDTCTIVIEDGYAKEPVSDAAPTFNFPRGSK